MYYCAMFLVRNLPDIEKAINESTMSVKDDNLQEQLEDLHLSADYCAKCLDELEEALELELAYADDDDDDDDEYDGLGELNVIILIG